MRERLKAMRRVLRVQELMEEIREAELLRAVAEVREADRAIELQRAIAQSSSREWRNALSGGDELTVSVSGVRQKAARGREARLMPLLGERERRSDESRQKHLDSRQWAEKMRRLTRKIEEGLAGVEEKRSQREADERYLSRRRWDALTEADQGEN